MANSRSSTVLADQLGTLYCLGAVGALRDDQLVERFLARNDPASSEAAFRALVDRHGAMVLTICQRVLQNPHDAHDAFQATFLVLVQMAGSIRRRQSVAGCLFGMRTLHQEDEIIAIGTKNLATLGVVAPLYWKRNSARVVAWIGPILEDP